MPNIPEGERIHDLEIPAIGDTVEITYGIYEGRIGTVVSDPWKEKNSCRILIAIEIHDYKKQVGILVTCPTVTIWNAYCEKLDGD